MSEGMKEGREWKREGYDEAGAFLKDLWTGIFLRLSREG